MPKHVVVPSLVSLACAMALDAHAQQAAPAPADAASAPRSVATLDTVVVTSQKRREDVKKVPLSVSVLSGDEVHENHITDFTDLARAVPNLSFSTQAGAGLATLEMRGVSSQAGSATVSIYLDDVSLTTRNIYSQGTAEPRFFDIDRVEVLRGPQGTLYGASSLGGVLKYVTHEPQFDSFEGRVRGSFETIDGGDTSYSGAAVANIPVSDKVAIRASGFYRQLGGFIDSIGTADSDVEKNINGSTVSGGRVSMLFKPSEAFSLQLTAFIQDIDSDASSSVDSDPVTGKTLYGDLTQSQYVPESTDVSYHVYNATAIWDLGFGDLTSATSYGENEQKFLVDFTTLLSGFFRQIAARIAAM